MQLDRYEVRGEIARGGFGAVYRAWDPTLQREVAIKVLLDDRDPDEVERFLREGQAATRIRHPNVLRILGGGSAEGRPYLVMELVEGPTLAARIAREREGLLVAEAVDLVVELASGLESAHQAGVLHRDLKPENVLFLEGRPLLTDFGIARLADARSLTQTGELLGTPGYMAPEQIEGDRARLGPPTDVYGLGAILYASLTGRAPFEGPTLLATLDQVLRTSPSPPSTHRAEVDRQLDAICLRALAREPGERYASAAEFAAALEAWATPDPTSEPGGGPALAIVAVLLFLLGGGLAAGAWSLTSTTPEETPSPTRSPSPSPSLATTPSGSSTPSASAPTPLPSDSPVARPSRAAAELLARGRAAVERDLDEATLLLSKAALDPTTQQAARVEQAFVQVKRRRLRAAQASLDATANQPAPIVEVARANYVSGRLLYELGQREKAHALFQKAVSGERSALYLAWLGITAPSKARAPILAEASALASEDPAVLYLQLLTDLTYNRSPPAARALLERFEAALQLAPISPYLAFYAPRLRWYAGDEEEALEAGRATVKAWPRYRDPYREAGWILAQRATQAPPLERSPWLEEARLAFEEGLKRFPQDIGLTRERAWLFVRAGRFARAIKAHEHLLSLEQGNVSGWSLHNTYLTIQQFFLHAVQSRDLKGVEDTRRAEALGRSVLDQMAATGYLRTRPYGRTPELEALTRTDLRLLLGRVFGIQRRWKSAARVLGPEIAGGRRQAAARYLHYMNREEEALYTLRPQRPVEELADEWNALCLSGHRAGIAESLEAKAVRKLPLPSQGFLDRVRGMKQVALRLELCEAISADPYDLRREAAIRARVVRADPGNLLAWHALLRQLLRHERTVSALQAIAAMPEAIARDPLILALKGEVLSANALVTGKNQEDQFAEAEAAFKQALAKEPRFEAVAKALLEHDLRRAKPLRARRAFDEIAERLPAAERERIEAEVLRLEKETR